MERRSEKSTKYKEVDKKSNEKAEQILKQENFSEEVKTTKNSVHICNKCTMSSERNTAIQYTTCKQWYHDECFKHCFESSLKSNCLYCFKCIIVLYRNIGNFLAFHHSRNLEILLQDWNTSGELSLQSFVFLDDEKLKKLLRIILSHHNEDFLIHIPIVGSIVHCKFFWLLPSK